MCSACKTSHVASNEEYLCSEYWPGSLSNNSFFIEEDLLCMWYYLRHKTLGTSERKFIETLQEISLENDRVSFTCCLYQSQIFLKLFFLIEQINIINRTLFNRARREFEYFHFLKDKRSSSTSRKLQTLWRTSLRHARRCHSKTLPLC